MSNKIFVSLQLHEAANIIQKLSLIAQELPSERYSKSMQTACHSNKPWEMFFSTITKNFTLKQTIIIEEEINNIFLLFLAYH